MAHYCIYPVYERAVDIFLRDWSMRMLQKDIEIMQLNCRRLMVSAKNRPIDIEAVILNTHNLFWG